MRYGNNRRAPDQGIYGLFRRLEVPWIYGDALIATHTSKPGELFYESAVKNYAEEAKQSHTSAIGRWLEEIVR
jgi:hypothetical protein